MSEEELLFGLAVIMVDKFASEFGSAALYLMVYVISNTPDDYLERQSGSSGWWIFKW